MNEVKKRLKEILLENETLKNRIRDFANLSKKYQELIAETCRQKSLIKTQAEIIRDYEKENDLLKRELKIRGL